MKIDKIQKRGSGQLGIVHYSPQKATWTVSEGMAPQRPQLFSSEIMSHGLKMPEESTILVSEDQIRIVQIYYTTYMISISID